MSGDGGRGTRAYRQPRQGVRCGGRLHRRPQPRKLQGHPARPQSADRQIVAKLLNRDVETFFQAVFRLSDQCAQDNFVAPDEVVATPPLPTFNHPYAYINTGGLVTTTVADGKDAGQGGAAMDNGGGVSAEPVRPQRRGEHAGSGCARDRAAMAPGATHPPNYGGQAHAGPRGGRRAAAAAAAAAAVATKTAAPGEAAAVAVRL